MKIVPSIWFLLSCLAAQAQATAPANEAEHEHRFTFSYPFAEGDAMKPRGSTGEGAPVTLDSEVSDAWTALRAPNISTQERDRRAILAMAGEYRVSFDFLEVVQFDTEAAKDVPYQNWATEKVYVLENRPDFVSLQHILVMHMLNEHGGRLPPLVTKHWRQDWRYEPDYLDEYLGPIRWQRRNLSNTEARGRWSQTAYQVDDSPRYAAIGRWRHEASFSTWQSAQTLRPLPRREYSFRSDYHYLTARNRHTILPTGWVQEENNLKTRIVSDAKQGNAATFVAREYGIARYQRIVATDFSAGDDYWQRSAPLWAEVRAYWSEWFGKGDVICLHSAPDQKRLYLPLFDLAVDKEALRKSSASELRDRARKIIDGYRSAEPCSSQPRHSSY